MQRGVDTVSGTAVAAVAIIGIVDRSGLADEFDHGALLEGWSGAEAAL
jgi:hypothetical protein